MVNERRGPNGPQRQNSSMGAATQRDRAAVSQAEGQAWATKRSCDEEARGLRLAYWLVQGGAIEFIELGSGPMRSVVLLLAVLPLVGCSDRMVYLLADGRSPRSDPVLNQQFEMDRTICAGELKSANISGSMHFFASVNRSCMATKGYVEVREDQAALKQQELAAVAAEKARREAAAAAPPPPPPEPPSPPPKPPRRTAAVKPKPQKPQQQPATQWPQPITPWPSPTTQWFPPPATPAQK
jgi:hypothetical protein